MLSCKYLLEPLFIFLISNMLSRNTLPVFILVLIYSLSSNQLNAQTSGDELTDAARSISSRNARQGADFRFSSYLMKDPTVEDMIEVSPRGINIYANPEAKRLGLVECRIYPDEYERFANLLMYYSMSDIIREYQRKGSSRWSPNQSFDIPDGISEFQFGSDPRKPLMGLRVALDPGHIAGYQELAELEDKYVKMREGSVFSDKEAFIYEAELTLVTAFLIQRSLESLGANVFITRQRPGRSVDGFTFEDWKETELDQMIDKEISRGKLSPSEAQKWKRDASEKDLFNWYNALDLEKRAAIINNFSPHLTLVIHYNVHEPNYNKRDDEGYFEPTEENYAMVFVPGAFTSSELTSVEDRIHFLRLLMTDQVRNSLILAEAFIESSQYQTGVPPVSKDSSLSYLSENCLATDVKGVYARNLRLTRKIRSPLCYGESLCQDNIEEIKKLSQKDKSIKGIPYSSRLEEIAAAYTNTVLEFAGFIGK